MKLCLDRLACMAQPFFSSLLIVVSCFIEVSGFLDIGRRYRAYLEVACKGLSIVTRCGWGLAARHAEQMDVFLAAARAVRAIEAIITKNFVVKEDIGLERIIECVCQALNKDRGHILLSSG